MDALIKALPNVLTAAGPSAEVREAAAMAAWRHATGAGLRDHAVALRLADRTLVVAVADAVWQKQLASMSKQLLWRTNSILGQPLVNWIEFVVDPQATKVQAEPKRTTQDDSLDNQVPLELYRAANAIQDPQLRKTFLKAAVRSLKRRDDKP